MTTTHTHATIVADSVSPAGHRLTTFECVFPRIILAEVNTHRMLSRNSASSRAIPIADMLKRVLDDPYVPTHWGKNQKGMSADEDVSLAAQDDAREEWVNARDYVMKRVRDLSNIGIHKQIANRPLEAFMWHTAVITGTELSNFFNLRDTKDAHPDFRDLAAMARELYSKNAPALLKPGEWHLPYVSGDDILNTSFDLTSEYEKHIDYSEAMKAVWCRVSVGRCARVSYDRLHEEETPEKSKARCDAMLSAGHMSPFEHVARPMTQEELPLFQQKKLRWDDARQIWVWVGAEYVQVPFDGGVGATSQLVKPGEYTHFLGNFNGWVQYRKLIPYEEDILGARM